MNIVTKKYIRKPLVVDVIQVSAKNFAAVALWCHGEILNAETDESEDVINPSSQYIKVRVGTPVSVRQTKAFIGDWILYTDKGYKIYTSRAFENSFMELNS